MCVSNGVYEKGSENVTLAKVVWMCVWSLILYELFLN